MPATPSNEIAIGTQAPAFRLADAGGKVHSLEDFSGAKALLVAFLSNRCPYVVHIRTALAAYARDYAGKGVWVIAFNANDVSQHAEESADAVIAQAKSVGYEFPYLKDESQDIAKAYGAACTPDLYLFDGDQKLFYHGQFDDSRPSNDIPVTGSDLRAATDLILAGKASPAEQKHAIGCNIKWIEGSEPAWFGEKAAV